MATETEYGQCARCDEFKQVYKKVTESSDLCIECYDDINDGIDRAIAFVNSLQGKDFINNHVSVVEVTKNINLN